MTEVAAKHGERVLETKSNNISIGTCIACVRKLVRDNPWHTCLKQSRTISLSVRVLHVYANEFAIIPGTDTVVLSEIT